MNNLFDMILIVQIALENLSHMKATVDVHDFHTACNTYEISGKYLRANIEALSFCR